MKDTATAPRFDEVKRRLRPGDVFHGADHDWKTQSDRRWKGSCPWHESSSGTCFSVNPDTLEWHCFHCERGGGPLQYVAELKNIGSGARGKLKGKDFFRVWKALSEHAGCEGPPEFDPGEEDGRSEGHPDRERRPLRGAKQLKKTRAAQRVGRASTTSEGGPSGGSPRTAPLRGHPKRPDLEVPERELRSALVRYREALKESERARAYVEDRGLSVGTLYRHGCGFAPAGRWIGNDNAPRLVTPHTTPPGDSSGGRLVNLSGRFLGDCDPGQRHRHIGGNPTALFNAAAIADGSGPLVFCEGPLDALSFIGAGWEWAVALHNTDGVPWKALRGSAEALVFAFDRDDTGRKDALERAIEARRRGFDAHVLHDEPAYGGHEDPNDALQAGELTLGYLRGLKSGDAAADSGNSMEPERRLQRGAPPQRTVPTPQGSGEDAGGDEPTVADPDGGRDGGQATDLVPHWNGDDIGHLGRWLWERGGVPEGDVGAGLYADRELHKWIKTQLEAGPQGTSEETQTRLRWVLWRLYAAHGPEEVPERQIPVPPMRRG